MTLMMTLLVSHQIAGPIFRYEKVLGQIFSGQFPEQISTRSTDQLKPMVDSLNDLTTCSRHVFGNAQILVEAIKASPDIDFKSLRQQISKVRESMGDFYSEERNQ